MRELFDRRFGAQITGAASIVLIESNTSSSSVSVTTFLPSRKA
jgi:hypothetical protein